MTTTITDARFKKHFNRMDPYLKVRFVNARIQNLDLALIQAIHMYEGKQKKAWAEQDLWLEEARNEWVTVRDRLVWDNEEVMLP